ncbi:MAG: Gfo/Idh/MocA family oxidoreductase, partial [Erysipelotrichaceae bacterium]
MKFGIVGTNFVSGFFMDGAKQVDKCDVVAVSDISMEGAKKFADQYGIPNYFDNYEKMYEAHLIDAV